MTTYSTQNPLGSSDPRDLYDNAENLDNLVNGDQAAYNDRLGRSRRSWQGVEDQVNQQEAEFNADQTSREQEFRTFIASSGYQFAGDYAAGIEITQYNQLVRDENGEFWRVSGSTTLPYTTTGAGMPEGGAFVAVGEAALRQELSLPVSGGNGATLVNGATIYVGSVAELKALTAPAGNAVFLTQEGRAGEFVIKFGTPPSDPQEGIYVVLDNGNYAERFGFSHLSPEMFGCVRDGVTNSVPAFIACAEMANSLGMPVACDVVAGSPYVIDGGGVIVTSTSWDFSGQELILKSSGEFWRVVPSIGKEEKPIPPSDLAVIMSGYKDGAVSGWDNSSPVTESFVHIDTDFLYTARLGYGTEYYINEDFYVATDGVVIGNPDTGLHGNAVNATYKPTESCYATMRNATFTLAATGLAPMFSITRNSTIIRDIILRKADNSPTSALEGSFFASIKVYDLTFINIDNDLSGAGLGGDGAYGYLFRPFNTVKSKFVNCKSTSRWGCFGGRYVKELLIDNADIGRFDTHIGCNNITIRNSNFFGWGAIVTSGRGTLLIDNCKYIELSTRRYSDGSPVESTLGSLVRVGASEVGVMFSGDIIIRDVDIINRTHRSAMHCVDVLGMGEGAINNLHTEIQLPNLTVQNVRCDAGARVDNLACYRFRWSGVDPVVQYKMPSYVNVSDIVRHRHSDTGVSILLTDKVVASGSFFLFKDSTTKVYASNVRCNHEIDPESPETYQAMLDYFLFRSNGDLQDPQRLFSHDPNYPPLAKINVTLENCEGVYYDISTHGQLDISNSVLYAARTAGLEELLTGVQTVSGCTIYSYGADDTSTVYGPHGSGIYRNNHVVCPTGANPTAVSTTTYVHNTCSPGAGQTLVDKLWFNQGNFVELPSAV